MLFTGQCHLTGQVRSLPDERLPRSDIEGCCAGKEMKAKRRDFLRIIGGGSVFPSILPSSALGRAGSVAPSDRIVMGMIGVGGMGGGHVRGFLQHADVRVAAICDVREERRQAAKNIVDQRYGDKSCETYDDFRELLARKDIDGVLIAVPDHWHALIGIEAARQGKSMYYEKPMGVSVAEAKAMREAVNRHGVIFQFGTQQRSGRDYQAAYELIRNGRIGQLKTMLIGSAWQCSTFRTSRRSPFRRASTTKCGSDRRRGRPTHMSAARATSR